MQLHSTSDRRCQTSLRGALASNLAPNGGLWAPALQPLDPAHWDQLLALPWPTRATALLQVLLADEFDPETVQQIAREALNFPLPIAQIDDETLALELWHGPTLAFKDFGARLLARLLPLVDEPEQSPRLILTATSGDTGAAVAAAFAGVARTQAVVLYPAGRVSPLQEQQIASLGGNIHAIRVAGTFDDCQALVVQCFADAALSAQLRLTSANSIHIGRLLAQVLYSTEVAAHVRRTGDQRPVTIAVPSGNFGNLCAALYARALGCPLGTLVAATNANRTVVDFLNGGAYLTKPSVATWSNAMDVGAPSNWRRIMDLYDNDPVRVRAALRWTSISDQQTRDEMQRLDSLGYLACPHTAVASAALQQVRQRGELGVVVSTAHPAKFPEVVQLATGRVPPLPPALQDAASRPLRAHDMPVDFAMLRAYLHDVVTLR